MPGFTSLRRDHRHHGIGRRGEDIGTVGRFLGGRHRLHLDSELITISLCKGVAIFLGRAEHLDEVELAHRGHGLDLAGRLPAGAEQAQYLGILAREVLGRDPGRAADAGLLDVAVVEHGEQLAGLGREQEHEPVVAVALGDGNLDAPGRAVDLGPVNHVGVEPERGHARRRQAARHGLERVDRLGARVRHDAVLARHVHGVLIAEVTVGGLQRRHARRHLQKALDILVGDDQHRSSLPFSCR